MVVLLPPQPLPLHRPVVVRMTVLPLQKVLLVGEHVWTVVLLLPPQPPPLHRPVVVCTTLLPLQE